MPQTLGEIDEFSGFYDAIGIREQEDTEPGRVGDGWRPPVRARIGVSVSTNYMRSTPLRECEATSTVDVRGS